jgi:SdrD B-like domain
MGSVGLGAARFVPRMRAGGACYLCPRFEPLESRAMLAVLGMGIQLRFNDDNGTPGDVTDDQPGAVIPDGSAVSQGDLFWVDVLVEDKRDDPQGVISLPVNYYWDPDKLELTDPPSAPGGVALDDELLTSDFVLQRFVDGFNAGGGHVGFPEPPPAVIDIPADPNIENLRGGALPNVGSGAAIATTSAGGLFSQLQFRALAAADNTPFTIELAGSMSFTDADALEGVDVLTSPDVRTERSNNEPPVGNQEALAVTEFIQILQAPNETELASLSGFVYIDTNPTDGELNRDNLGVAVEFGIPNVTLSLFLANQLIDTTTTGADGAYLFDGLDEGVYRIVETQPPLFISSASSVGTVLPSGDERGVEADVDQISEIRLALGDHGIDYNFGEVVIPDKRMFLARTDMREILASQRGIAARTIDGTSGDDTIVVEPVGDALRVTVNNQAPQQIPLVTARILYLDSRGGQDTVEFRGAAGDEVANLSPGTGAMRLGEDYQDLNYAVMAVAAETVIANGGGGNDLAVLRDSPGNDELVAAGNTATLTSADNALAQALAFERVRALSEVRPGATDQDTASVGATDYVLDTVGKWQLI